MEDLEKKINYLIKNNLGDWSRLNELLLRVKSDKPIYNSDLKYVEKYLPSPLHKLKVNETLVKSETSNISSKPNSKKNNSVPLRNIRDIGHPYGISYNIYQRDEVKIHKGTCSKYQNASQQGAVKWEFANSLKEALSITGQLYSKYGDWKCPRCCLYNGASYFECVNCKRYSEGYDNTEKLHSKSWRITSIVLLIIPFLFILSGIQHRLNGLNILLVLIGIILLLIENYRAPQVCRNCLSKNHNDHFIYK